MSMRRNWFGLTYRTLSVFAWTEIRKLSTEMDCSRLNSLTSLIDYTPPKWLAENLKREHIPKVRLHLANLPTPVQRWALPDLPPNVNLLIKRDDMTGATLSGNKVRKLEFIMAKAVETGCKHVITCGGLQSNHCRAVAVSAAELGLQAHLVLRGHKREPEVAGYEGNVRLDRLTGAKLYMCASDAKQVTDFVPRMNALKKELELSGEKALTMPVGGSDEIGVFGYLEAFNEIQQQGLLSHITDIVCGCGSGGTLEALAIANYLAGNTVKIHGIAVCDDEVYFLDHLQKMMDKLEIKNVRAEDIAHIAVHKGKGYAIAQQEDYEFIKSTARGTGIILDPTYTAKAARGLLHELQQKPQNFKGNNVLFIHTGGVFGLYQNAYNDALFDGNDGVKSWLHF